MKRTLFSLFLLAALMATASAQKRLINDHWQFVRLSGDTAAWKAGKQGTSWGSLEKVCGYRSTIKILFCPFIKLNNG